MVSPDYMLTQQSDINERMRAILVDWLVEVTFSAYNFQKFISIVSDKRWF